MDTVQEKISGEIIRVRYRAENGEFAVAVIRTGDGAEITVCGTLAGIEPGQNVELCGEFRDHPEFGRQFQISSCHAAPPGSDEGMIRFLSNAVPGLGPKNAAAIVQFFGGETAEILNRFPRRLREVPGIGAKRAAEISRIWKESAGQRDTLIYLQGLGITPAYCARVLKRYGEQSAAIVQTNPYRLADEVDGIGFLKADMIARAQKISIDNPDRLAAGALYAMNTLVGYGHVCAPEPELRRCAAGILKVDEKLAGKGIEEAISRKFLAREGKMIYTPLLIRAETMLPRRIARLAASSRFYGRRLAEADPAVMKMLAPEQRAAVEAVRKYPLSIITGGPGVGKTTVVGTIVKLAECAGLQIMLAAPTGRAAKRLSESSGMDAKTIHRLLGYDPRRSNFEYNAQNPLSIQLLIVDEISMLDLPLAEALFAAVPEQCSVVLVGDADQLPSVGPGTVLADFITSGFFAVTRLTQVFRQAAQSSIITGAHQVLQGIFPQPPPPSGELKDYYRIEAEDGKKAEQIVAKLLTERIPARFGLDPVRDIQVLTPMNRGDGGAFKLNSMLEKLLTDEAAVSFRFGERIFREGDKVMQRTNNYDKLVFNGDCGILSQIDEENKKFICVFDGGSREVEYAFDEADQLIHAYAITVHKSQGGEYPAVVLVLLNSHYLMLRRNLLYTAMTRAKKLLILVGTEKAIGIALSNNRREVRFSLLAERFRRMREPSGQRDSVPTGCSRSPEKK